MNATSARFLISRWCESDRSVSPQPLQGRAGAWRSGNGAIAGRQAVDECRRVGRPDCRALHEGGRVVTHAMQMDLFGERSAERADGSAVKCYVHRAFVVLRS